MAHMEAGVMLGGQGLEEICKSSRWLLQLMSRILPHGMRARIPIS